MKRPESLIHQGGRRRRNIAMQQVNANVSAPNSHFSPPWCQQKYFKFNCVLIDGLVALFCQNICINL
jgi:hypothetical protein